MASKILKKTFLFAPRYYANACESKPSEYYDYMNYTYSFGFSCLKIKNILNLIEILMIMNCLAKSEKVDIPRCILAIILLQKRSAF